MRNCALINPIEMAQPYFHTNTTNRYIFNNELFEEMFF